MGRANLDTAIPRLRSIFDAAMLFGLSDREVWATMDDVAARVGGDATLPDYVDELAAALARDILAKQRRMRASGGS